MKAHNQLFLYSFIPNKASSGFTLIEMMAVLFLISVLLSLTALSVNHSTNKSLSSDAEFIMSFMQEAQEDAFITGHAINTYLLYDTTSKQWHIENRQHHNDVWKTLNKHSLSSLHTIQLNKSNITNTDHTLIANARPNGLLHVFPFSLMSQDGQQIHISLSLNGLLRAEDNR